MKLFQRFVPASLLTMIIAASTASGDELTIAPPIIDVSIQDPIQPVSEWTAKVSDSDLVDSCRCGECASCKPGIHGLSIGGWIEQGITFNFASPRDRSNAPLLFNDRSNDYMLNQLYLFAEKQVCADGCQWDVGGRIDVNFGTDSRFLTVPGLERHRDGTRKWNAESPSRLYGLALPQAYLEIAAPWLNGVSMKAGHFYANAGYESPAATQNFFYSHSYTFLFGEPFTYTGALASIKVSDRVTVNAGFARGWDVSSSFSSESAVLAGFTLTSVDNRTSLTANFTGGNDVTNFRSGGALIDEDRFFYSLVLQHEINDCWRYVLQHDFGYQDEGTVVVNLGPRTITFDPAKWYSINQYLIHDVNETLSAALRVEWFRDQNHSRLGVPVVFNPGGPTFLGGNYVGLTAGLNWQPLCNLIVRPELRWDSSDLQGNPAAPGGNPAVRAYNVSTDSDQFTAALDVILTY